MSDQVRDCFLIQLMFSDSQAKKLVGKKWRIILPVTKFCTDEILCRLFFFREGTTKQIWAHWPLCKPTRLLGRV